MCLTRRLFPWLMDWSMGHPALEPLRRETLAATSGDVLEVGFGSGRNLPFYPPAVSQLTVLDPNPGTWRLAEPRVAQSALKVVRHDGSALAMPFADASFDFVVSTFTLCSVARVEQALAETRRVLRPGGQFCFLEHGLSPNLWTARLQHLGTPVTRLIGGGCHLNRPIEALVRREPFARVECQADYLAALPAVGGYLYRGRATA